MISLNTVQTLTKHGYSMEDAMRAVTAAESSGSADLDGWIIRHNKDGEMILIHPSYCGIYLGDYSTHIIFQKNISYRYGRYGYMHAKHRDLPAVLGRVQQDNPGAFILCECHACDFPRRKKQVEKLGYTVRRSNISGCNSDISPCFFLIARPA